MTVPEIQEIVEGLPPNPSFADLLAALYAGKFRGALLLHFDAGTPKVVEFPQPTRVALAAPDRRRTDRALTCPVAEVQATGA